MPKIDLKSIPDYEKMTPEQKLAALEGYELPAPDMSNYVPIDTANKYSSEVAALKKELRERMSDAEKAAQDRQAMLDEIAALRRDQSVSNYTARCLSLGCGNDHAAALAAALADGDADKVFATLEKVLTARDKALRADLLRQTPAPPAGNGQPVPMDPKTFREKYPSMEARAKFAQENPEEYQKIYERS